MSLDNQATVDLGDVGSPLPTSGGSKSKWILGGCGCIGLLAVLCVVGGIVFGLNMIDQVRQEARSFVESSSVVQEQLGSPVAIDGEVQTFGADLAPSFRFSVSGPKGGGTVTVSSVADNQARAFVVSEYILEVDGQEFDLNAEDDFKMDLEGMDDL